LDRILAHSRAGAEEFSFQSPRHNLAAYHALHCFVPFDSRQLLMHGLFAVGRDRSGRTAPPIFGFVLAAKRNIDLMPLIPQIGIVGITVMCSVTAATRMQVPTSHLTPGRRLIMPVIASTSRNIISE